MSKRFILILSIALPLTCCNSWKKSETYDVAAPPIGATVELEMPLGLPPVTFSNGNKPTADAIALGRRLFNDVKLSADDSISCANCHNPAMLFTDGLAVSKGIGGQKGRRNAPTLLNAAYNVTQFWDGRAASLEEQAGVPIMSPGEMNQPHDVCIAKLSAEQTYRDEFTKVFGPGPITMKKIENAIASFERTLISGNSAFDRYQYGGDRAALDPAAIRGLEVFRDKNKGNCATCHLIEKEFALFTDGKFHNLGVGMNSSGELTDLGRFEKTGVEVDRGAFRTPGLRNVSRTAPYMHDGSLKTLEEVLDFYIGGGSSNPQLDVEIRPLNLSARDRSDLIAFLEALTGDKESQVRK